MGKLGGKTFNVNQLFLTYLPFKNLKEMNPLSFTLLALAAAVCLSVPISTYPLNQRSINHEFGFLEDIENEIIKDTIKTTVKTLIENAQSAVENGKDFDEVIQKLGSELESFGKVALWAVKEYLKWNKESISATLGDQITEAVLQLVGGSGKRSHQRDPQIDDQRSRRLGGGGLQEWRESGRHRGQTCKRVQSIRESGIVGSQRIPQI